MFVNITASSGTRYTVPKDSNYAHNFLFTHKAELKILCIDIVAMASKNLIQGTKLNTCLDRNIRGQKSSWLAGIDWKREMKTEERYYIQGCCTCSSSSSSTQLEVGLSSTRIQGRPSAGAWPARHTGRHTWVSFAGSFKDQLELFLINLFFFLSFHFVHIFSVICRIETNFSRPGSVRLTWRALPRWQRIVNLYVVK